RAYDNGVGVPQDHAEAARLFRKAADQGDASAQANLGRAYDNGEGVPQDYAEAARLFRKAADQGNASAQSSLGLAYFRGKGVPQDREKAARLFRKAADQGNASGQHNLGRAYFAGLGVPLDYREAYFWANLAAAINKDVKEDSFASLRDGAAAKLSPAELSAVQKRCRQWMDAFEKRKAQK
ncbi:MAG TPA: tetratricopeptide repeat protein, partial [Polyangia bacterium]|nr:tetratricopeptide repeat protein [Polyangia bacterium]